MPITAASKIGLRDYQEDRHVIYATDKGTLLAVMDGHGGADVAEVCNDYLSSFWDLSCKQDVDPLSTRPFDKALELTIWQLASITNEYHSGSTISLAFIPTAEDVVYMATLGDSPVIVRAPDGICHVSTSHNVRTNIEEQDAAIKRGGWYEGGYIWGIGGSGLQMARALGDSSMGPVISKTPAVETHTLGDFVLVATDGVFDPAHTKELQAIADVTALIDAGADAHAIVDRAVKLKTGDNATAILWKRS